MRYLIAAILAMSPSQTAISQEIPCGAVGAAPCPSTSNDGLTDTEIIAGVAIIGAIGYLFANRNERESLPEQVAFNRLAHVPPRNDIARMAYIEDSSTPLYVPDQVLFTFVGDSTNAQNIATATGLQLFEVTPLVSINRTLARAYLSNAATGSDTVAAAMERLAAHPDVTATQPNYIFHLLGEASRSPSNQDLLAGFQENETLPPAVGSIAIIDTPIDVTHDALKRANISQFDFSGVPAAGQHGTSVASLIGGDSQIYGSARGAKILSYSAFEQSVVTSELPLSSTHNIVRALDAAILDQPDVINMSFGGPEDPLFSDLLDKAESLSICAVAAAGNGGGRAPSPFPGTHPHTLSITAIDRAHNVYQYATSGDHVDLAALGVDVFSAAPDNTYLQLSGTSFSTAIASGLLLRTGRCGHGQNIAQLRNELSGQALDLGATGRDNMFGHGLLRLNMRAP